MLPHVRLPQRCLPAGWVRCIPLLLLQSPLLLLMHRRLMAAEVEEAACAV